MSGKKYISYLAELFGGNAKIGRDGKCYIIPLKDNTKEPISIDALQSKSFEVGDIYEISRVCYDNGKLKLQSGGNVITVESLPNEGIDTSPYYYLTTDLKYYMYAGESWVEATNVKNTLYIRQDNLFVTQQEEIESILSVFMAKELFFQDYKRIQVPAYALPDLKVQYLLLHIPHLLMSYSVQPVKPVLLPDQSVQWPLPDN